MRKLHLEAFRFHPLKYSVQIHEVQGAYNCFSITCTLVWYVKVVTRFNATGFLCHYLCYLT